MNNIGRIVSAGIGLAVGVVIGMALWFIGGMTSIALLITPATIGPIAGVSLYWLAGREFIRNPTRRQHSTQLVVVLGVFGGLALAVAYKATTPVATLSMAALVWLIMAFLVGLFAKRIIDRRDDLKSRPTRHINITNNFMGNALDRHLHMLSDKETRVDYAARPPLIQALILMGIPLELTVVSAWGITGFVNASVLFNDVIGANPFVRGLAIATLFGLILLALVSWLEQPVRPLRALFLVLGLGMGFGVWYAFGSPLGTQLVSFIRTDLSHIWVLLFLVFATWTTTRLVTYIDSAYIVTDRTFYKGADSWLLQTDPINTMERSKMANAQIKVGILRFLLGYQLVKREGLGQEDQKFGRNRVTHGQILQKVLTN